MQATRDFWLAETDLQAALTGRSPEAAPTTAVTATPEPQAAGH